MNPDDKEYLEEEARRIYERLQGRDLAEEYMRREAEMSGEVSDLIRKESDIAKAAKWYKKAAEVGDKVMPDSWGEHLTLRKGPSVILPHNEKTMPGRGKSEGMKVGNAKPSVGYANVRELTRTQTAVKPRLAVKVAKPAVVRAVRAKPRPNILLTVLQTARTKLAHITLAQIKADPMTVLRQIGLVKKAVVDELGGPTIEDIAEASGRYHVVDYCKRLVPDRPPPDPVEEKLKELKSSATDAMRSLRHVADGEGDAKLAHEEVRRFNKAVTLTLAIVDPRADGSVLTTPIGKVRRKDLERVLSGIRGLEGVFPAVPVQEAAPVEESEPHERRRRTRLVRPGSRAANYADLCKYIIDCLEDWRKSLKKAHRTELEHGVTKNLSLPSVQYIADWIVQEKKKSVTRRKVEWALFCALGTSVDNYKQKHNVGRQAFEERQQLLDSKANAKKTDLSLKVKDYRFSDDLDKLNPTIIRYWENMTTNCAFVLLPRKRDASAVKFDRERYIRALRLALQTD